MKQSIQLLTLVSLLFLAACSQAPEATSATKETASYSTALFSPTAQFKTHQVAAFVEPTNQANLAFQVSGVIATQYIKIGDEVLPEQRLFKITNPSLVPQINQFESQIEAINATMAQNQAEVLRYKNLQKTNAISQNDLDKLTNEKDNLAANKKSLEAQLEQAKSLYEESYLKAPFAGNVAEIYKQPGEVISPGEAVLVIGGVNSLEAPIYLPSFLHDNLQLGQLLAVKYNHQSIAATVKEISHTANPKSQLFKVMLDVPITEGLKSGEKITVQIKENMGDYYRLPIESVIDDGINRPFVLLIVDQQVQRAPIELIEIVNAEVIVSMPQQGEVEVVTGGQANLSPLQKLTQS